MLENQQWTIIAFGPFVVFSILAIRHGHFSANQIEFGHRLMELLSNVSLHSLKLRKHRKPCKLRHARIYTLHYE